MQIITELPPQLNNNTYVALDIEMFGLNPKQLHRPTSGKFACLSICYEPNKVYLIENQFEIPEAFSRIKDAIWILHKAKFDLTHLRRWAHISPRKKLWDTMLIEKILWGGYYEFFALEHLARRYLDIFIDKSLQKSFEKAEELSDEQRQYAAQDANITLQVFQKQRKHITKRDFRVWQEVDLIALWAFMDMPGIAIDVRGWEALSVSNKLKSDQLDEELSFNPRSYAIVKEQLRKAGFKGLPSTGEDILRNYMVKYPDTEATILARKTLEARKYSTRVRTYGMNFIKDYIEEDLIHKVPIIIADYSIIGAQTGRTAASNPPLHGVPARDTKDFRKCVIARPGNKLIIVDWSAQEPGITAYLSQDEELLLIFKSKKDVYIESAKRVFEESIKKSDPRRKKMKSVFLGIDYGMSPFGLAKKEDISLDEAEYLINRFFKVFPGVAIWVNQQKKKKKYTTTVIGRKSYLNPYSNQCERNALNNPHQGTAADMLKKSMGRIHREWKWEYPYSVVHESHDEIICDVPEKIAEEVRDFVCNIMEEVANEMCPGVGFRVEAVIGDNWGSKE